MVNRSKANSDKHPSFHFTRHKTDCALEIIPSFKTQIDDLFPRLSHIFLSNMLQDFHIQIQNILTQPRSPSESRALIWLVYYKNTMQISHP